MAPGKIKRYLYKVEPTTGYCTAKKHNGRITFPHTLCTARDYNSVLAAPRSTTAQGAVACAVQAVHLLPCLHASNAELQPPPAYATAHLRSSHENTTRQHLPERRRSQLDRFRGCSCTPVFSHACIRRRKDKEGLAQQTKGRHTPQQS